MVKKRVSVIIFALMALSLAMIGVRLFAKMVLVNKLNMDSPLLRVVADYSWGDVMEKETTPEAENPSEELQQLTGLYSQVSADVAAQTALQTGTETEPQSGQQYSVSSGIVSSFNKVLDKINILEDNLETYSGTKFMPYVALETINDMFDGALGWSDVYARTEGTDYKLADGSKYSAVEQSGMEEKDELIFTIGTQARACGADFLYVQLPFKAQEDGDNVPWGASAYENQNADTLLQSLAEEQVDVLDLRAALKEEGWKPEGGFYVSDGHWTIPTAFLASKCIASRLNADYGYAFGDEIFDRDNYESVTYSTNNLAAPDKVEQLYPKFETDLIYRDGYRNTEYAGSYTESLLDMRMMADVRSTVLTIYMANRVRNSYLCSIENQLPTNNEGKRLLILSNSFSWYVAGFLALDTEEVYYSYYYDNAEAAEQMIRSLCPDMVLLIN
jgi:hypothetical protein